MSLLPLRAASSTSLDVHVFRQRSFSLYRKYLRQVNRLPFAYLRYATTLAPGIMLTVFSRYFFQFKAQDDIRALLATKEHGRRPHLRERKFKRLAKARMPLCAIVQSLIVLPGSEETRGCEQQRVRRRMDAYTQSCIRTKGQTEARINGGQLRSILPSYAFTKDYQPHLTDPTQPLPARIIPAVPKSHPPVYSEILKTLLTNSLSRSTSPSTKNNYNVPLKLPDRTSPEAIIVNAPWKRREVNARWRHFVESTNNTYYPLGVSNEGPRTLLNSGVLDDVHNIVGPVEKINPLTRKERQALERQGKPIPPQTVNRYPSRWIRRRFQKVLAHVPILSQNGGRYQVSISKVAISKHDSSGNRLPEIDEVSEAWITHKNSSRPSR